MGAKDDADEDSRLKKAFEAFDTDGNGALSFDEFYLLLQKGNSDFDERHAHELFREADADASGAIDFNEFVDYLYGHKEFREIVQEAEEELEENVAKLQVMCKSVTLRSETSKSLREKGKAWKKLSWRERLVAVTETEECLPAELLAVSLAETKAAAAKTSPSPSKEALSPSKETPSPSKEAPPATPRSASMQSTAPPEKPPPSRRASVFDHMSQQGIVDYAIHRYDLSFAGREHPDAQEKLYALREHIRSATGPDDIAEIKRFLAKGTAGWVFEVHWKESGGRAAMKLIRMTQALSGIKEWYVSKCLRQAGIDAVVLTDETVRVVDRSKAPPVIAEQLENAGPVNHYLCMFQEFMGGGSLEELESDGKMTPQMMFQAMADVASTLARMHELQIHHRDVKPENVLIEMKGDKLEAAKLCDFGSATFSNDGAGVQDDIRRFGVTLFSLATGEPWTKNRLIHAKHEDLIARLKKVVKGSSEKALSELPHLMMEILSGRLTMSEIAERMVKLSQAF